MKKVAYLLLFLLTAGILIAQQAEIVSTGGGVSSASVIAEILAANNSWAGSNIFTVGLTAGSSAGAANSVRVAEDGTIIFEGSAANAHEVTIGVVNPAADTSFAFPAVALGGDFNIAAYSDNADNGIPFWDANSELLIADLAFTWVTGTDTLQIEAVDAAHAISIGNNASSIIFEGSGADTNETTLDVANPSADATVRIRAFSAGTYEFAFEESNNTWTAQNTWSATTNEVTGVISVVAGAAIVVGSGTASTENRIQVRSECTPDCPSLNTGSTANFWLIAETGDAGFDFAHAAQTNPTLFIHSTNQSTTQWISFTHNGTNGIIDVGAGSVSVSDSLSTTGTLTSSRTTDIGWSIVTAANQACNTTCSSACVPLGYDSGAPGVYLACTDATADVCVCAGGS